MPFSSLPAPSASLAAAPPSTPLGPFEDSALAWAGWTTVMSFVGLIALALLVAAPARTAGARIRVRVRSRLAAASVASGLLAGPAAWTALAHEAAGGPGAGYDYAAAWDGLFDGTTSGLLSGLQVTLPVLGAILLAPAALRPTLGSRAGATLLLAGLTTGLVALGSARFPTQVRNGLGRTVMETVVWMLHLFGAAVWLGGLVGLLLLALPGAVDPTARAAFWGPAVRRFSVAAMACVAAITLSGLFLYWEHVDGLGQLVSTMYGRVLGVKILVFGSVLALGAFNQFWLHPRIEALRVAGDPGRRAGIALRRFPVVVAAEIVLVLLVLLIAPFLHGSARNQAFQAEAARHTASATAPLPKLPPKQASASTWGWGISETVSVAGVMAICYRCSGRIARRRTADTAPAPVAPATAG
ncbi:CopD family protein [Streptacidiphilus jiangxiensis]|uniref:Putative copper export protein n=1 Tax=Streptacidiphilus jiangxiensis TaxID=235985 RepID=A0A1H7ZCM6_STRJI|nr:CopD family protein [Streptacidiphilus jiangxiensis]SEM55981.1 Putative copper export protein [Streptacidiphilus jiangxiensis]